MTRLVWLLLVVVAAAAAVLSFDALRSLALLCGFTAELAWLLPVVVDAGAGVGCLVWLGRNTPTDAARFARALTWSLLAGSVAGNAVVHGLSAYALPAPWWLVVAVSAIPPAVLGASVHLAVLVGRRVVSAPGDEPGEDEQAGYLPAGLDDHGVSRRWDDAPPVGDEPGGAALVDVERAGELIAAGVGRRRLARELNISEHTARQLLARNGTERGGDGG
jgi:hypothetical protein